MFARTASVLTLVLAASCAPTTPARHVDFQAQSAPQKEHHTKISPLGVAGIALLGAAGIAWAGVAIFVFPRTSG